MAGEEKIKNSTRNRHRIRGSSGQRHGSIWLVLFCLLLGIQSALSAALEAAPQFRGSTEQRIRLLETQASPTGLSVAAKKLVLDDCLFGLRSVYGRTLRTERRQRILAGCTSLARDITEQMPAWSYPWFLRAALAAATDGELEFNQTLAMSYKTAPTEQWVAELRVATVEDHLELLNESNLSQHRQDLELMVTSTRGIGAIAARYLREETFRERIVAIVEQLPASEQRRFLATIRRHAAP